MTSPIIRSLKKALPDTEIHFFTKKAFANLVQHNPQIDKIHLLEAKLETNLKQFREEKFDFILDLHNNLRSGMIKRRLGIPSATYPKFSLRTRLYIHFRIGSLPDMHVVKRYAKAMEKLGISLDEEGLELFLPAGLEEKSKATITEYFEEQPVAIVLGATFNTKRWIPEYFPDMIQKLGKPVVLLGGPTERDLARAIESKIEVPCLNAAGAFGLLESAALMRECRYVITHDTGFMHIAAAFGMQIYSIWGQTVPELGFTPYKAKNVIIQNEGLDCRPCHKLGHDACPKGHFKCMKEITPDVVVAAIGRGNET